MTATVTLIPGDGIGPEIVDGAVRVFEAAGADVGWDRQLAGVAAMEEGLGPLPDETTDSILENKVALKGPLTTPVGEGFRSINVALRKHFDLYANVRPAKTLMRGGRYEDVDLIVIRENTEGLYVGIEHFIGMEEDPEAAAESVMIVTRYGAERIARFAFDYAVTHDRRKVTLVHKANILKCTQGLFLEVGRKIAEDYAGRIEFEDRIVDNTAMQLVVDPYQFDVIVTENMFGDILSDEASGLIGGLGLAPGANIGNHAAIFEAVHGSAPDIAGQGIANPSAVILAGCMMFDYLGASEVAERVREALTTALAGPVRTRDLGGDASTREFSHAIIEELRD
ncbi:MAG: NAD-dependent isocitrate dehydrogenase [Gemmatimonadetes bacterium]|uniref:NAD-dependent isocitrate dehydrogenase n=1 Tax=Candidatus Kutchimonas denitrificans TaxID=3056748 RepID=A0AAE5C9H9_9BACT|nr:NAD-dependent isocitrate dehydrogenase [Gemmatimonadota bacterium]NIR75496.1 NAD-dependent isocitrate dehydrogenase [Candidatus Kutchimonas denitrificans]NIS01810.1 NAD-dependent isocitrate dehydrogenase [Gemmatimonadota bacterium]NIT67591.1 NAD-dependent isocitrate dehydrogenase [Gemmatimonadota bacterium]NIU53465.1 NAD-dependent isocitrate dehydrogenase [Gemmatimonadota bacterium]